MLRAGALADAGSVFGARQPGVRVVVTESAIDAVAGGEPAVALVEDDQTSLPGWVVGQMICETGAVRCGMGQAVG